MIAFARLLQRNSEGRPHSSLGDLGRVRLTGQFVTDMAQGPTGMPFILDHNAKRVIGFVSGLSLEGPWLTARLRITSDKHPVRVGAQLSVGLSIEQSYFDDKTGLYVFTAGALEEVTLLSEGTSAFAGSRIMHVSGEVKPTPKATVPAQETTHAEIKNRGKSEGSFGTRLTSMTVDD